MPQHPKHPARLAAIAAGERTFIGPDCAEHPCEKRWTSSGQCISCNRARSREQGRRFSGSPEEVERRAELHTIRNDPARLDAVAAGSRTWRGRACRHGHDERYTALPSGCAVCSRTRSNGARA